MDASHQLWVLVHILLFAYWLGTDLGVFYLSFLVRNKGHGPGTRAVLAKAMLTLDLAPRVCLVLTLPVGLTLAANLGFSPITGGWLALVWVASLVWLAVVLTIFRQEGSPLGRTLGKFDMRLRVVLSAALIVAAVVSLAFGYPFETARLALKVALFGLIVALGLGIRLTLKPFGPALRSVLDHGSSLTSERQLEGALKRAYPLVLAIWGSLIAAAYLGVS